MTGFPKPTPVASKVTRGLKRFALKAKEDANKKAVRLRDKRCRFPLCGCKKFNLALHVSHSTHKGMGGDPTGERSQRELMVYLCSARHKENSIAIDRGTLRWWPTTEAGADGPIIWWVDRLVKGLQGYRGLEIDPDDEECRWAVLAREKAPGVLEPPSISQRAILQRLAEMTA